MDFERSGGLRRQFSATAEIRGASSPSRVGRVKDLSFGGCYVAMPEPFSEGFEVTVRLTTESEVFECDAVVSRVTHGIGMGLRFHTIEPRFRRVLESWLGAAQAGPATGEEEK